MIVVDSLATHLDVTSQVVDLAWSEWGIGLPDEEYQRWLRLAAEDARLNSTFSAAFVALDGNVPIGVVQLHESDIKEMNDRSPWVCGMIVKPDYRSRGIGRRLLGALESFAISKGVERLWGFTESATTFYEKCGWLPYANVIHDGKSGMVLTKQLESQRRCSGICVCPPPSGTL